MSKISVELRRTDIKRRAAVECNRMRQEGFSIPRGAWNKLPLREDMTRQELRDIILSIVEGDKTI